MTKTTKPMKAKPELKLEHLAPYLPYGLKLWHESWECELTMNADGSGSEDLSILDVEEYAKPILRPLSDLTKEIQHNGEKFVPIVELHKIATEHQKGKGQQIDKIVYNKKNTIAQLIFKHVYFHNGEPLGKIIFEIDTDIVCFSIIHTYEMEENYMFVQNQLQLFQKLFEWHFDVEDLIGKNLGISVHELSSNPYK